MSKADKKNITREIMALARKIRRIRSHSKDHFTGLDRLRIILIENENINLKDLAKLMDIRPPSLSEWTEKLIENGELIKKKDEKDKRVINLSLTVEGKKQALISLEKSKKASLFEGCLSQEEEEIFFQLTEKLSKHLDKNFSSGNSKGHKHHGRGKKKHHTKNKESKKDKARIEEEKTNG